MDEEAAEAATTPPVGRSAPFSRRAVAPVGVTPPTRTETGEISSSPPPMALFAGAKPVETAKPVEAATTAQTVEQQRLAALEARRTQAAERPSWFLSPPPAAPVSTSPFALVSSRPEPAPAEPAGPTAEEIAAEAERAQLQAYNLPAGATVIHPDALRGALTAPQSPPTPVVPPIIDSPAKTAFAHAAPEAPTQAASSTAPEAGPAPEPVAEGLLSASAPESVDSAESGEAAESAESGEAPAKRRGRLKRGDRKAATAEPVVAAAEAAAPAEDILAQEAAMEAYRRYAREGTMVTEDYYRGPVEELARESEPTVVIAESLIPTGKPRLAKQPDKPRGPKIVAALAVVAIGGGGWYYATHQVTTTPVVGLPSITLDQTTAATSGTFTVPPTATSGAGYHLTVPPGWKAVSSPTLPGGSHTDVTVTEPILNLRVVVHSEKSSEPNTVVGRTVDTALRVFGHPAGIVAAPEPANSATVSRVATVTMHDVRYSVTLTVPRESAARDYARAAVVARSLTQ